MSEYRHMSTGSLNIPGGVNGNGGGQAAGPRFDGPRSPPGRQSKFMVTYGSVWYFHADGDRYISRSLQILPARCLSGWKRMPFQPRPGEHNRKCVQIFCKGSLSISWAYDIS
jgi:hypothetical protein